MIPRIAFGSFVTVVIGLFAASPTRAQGVDVYAALPTPSAHASLGTGATPGVTVIVNLPALGSARGASPSPRSGLAAGSAEGAGLSLPVIHTCVSCTQSSSSGNSGSASSNALNVLGIPLSGGSAVNNSSDKNALAAVGLGPLGSAFVAEWFATSESTGSSNSSSATGNLIDVHLGDELATVMVLHSTSSTSSNESPTSSSASGSSSNDGARASALHGAIVVVLLHSESSSNGTARAYVASINGNEIGASSGGGVPVTIPGVGTITLVSASSSGGQSSASGAQGSGAVHGVSTGAIDGAGGTAAGGTGNGTGAVQAASGQRRGGTSAGNVNGIVTPITGVVMNLLFAVLLLVGGGVVVAVSSAGRRRGLGPWRVREVGVP